MRQYAANRSLWLDESFFALNIIEKSVHDLLTIPLDFKQSAPAGFLVVEKLADEAFGNGEYALRAFPLFWGIVSLVLYVRLARRVLEPAGAAIAVAMFAFAGPLVYYSSELKPYAGDIAATIAIALIGLEMLRRRWTLLHAVGFGLLGLLLIQFTYAGILAATGTGAVLIAIIVADRRWDRLGSVVVAIGIWALGAAVFLFSRVGAKPSYLGHGEPVRSGGHGPFAPFPASKSDIAWYFRRVTDIAADANLYHTLKTPLVLISILATTLAVVGAVNLLSRNWQTSAVLLSPVIVTLAASGARQYPMLARTILFFVPLAFLLIANGTLTLARRLPPAMGAFAAAILVAVLLVHVSFAGMYNVARPIGNAEIKKSLIDVAQHWRAGDVLYLHYASQYAFGYYSLCGCFRVPRYGDPRSLWPVRRAAVRDPSAQFPPALVAEKPRVFIGVAPSDEARDYARDASLISEHQRAWIVITFTSSPRELARIERHLLGSLDRRGRRVSELFRGGVHLYLYEFSIH